jgi:peptidoglycan hydrolase-like protein with peptidoglycan-binding domain
MEVNVTLLGQRAGRLAATFTALVAASLGIIVAPSPANAGSISCDNTTVVWVGDRQFTMPSVGKNTGNFECVLGIGNYSAAVRILQVHLNACYWSGSPHPGHRSTFSRILVLDGDFGSRTASALASAQRSHGIEDDGEYGPETRRTLNYLTSASYCWPFGD